MAAFYGDESCLRALIKLGANIEAKDKYGTNPLYFAATNEKDACVTILQQAKTSSYVVQ